MVERCEAINYTKDGTLPVGARCRDLAQFNVQGRWVCWVHYQCILTPVERRGRVRFYEELDAGWPFRVVGSGS